ncbi:catechol 2,3-dioxygenase-like lactoylglutathione lyase family enzyme [Rheinheimera pacifica]|uniref:VOC family protein n=1 Tax=Rheinheimera pacifica TaxID=173990 RepID=UPI0021678C14|nr:VOC family protein [Rheinheimera pacifica]MCS4307542.1 catechol 2,3-dioxygenase-like lactoylglutathione lyase family enzyme [Rheinheimera pacifica]
MAAISNVALLVTDYDEAIAFYTRKLGFDLLEDTNLGAGKRWVQVAPKNNSGTALLLAKATNEKQLSAVGEQAGGRVWLFLQTDDFWRDYHAMQTAGVVFLEAPRQEPYATVVVFEDLYGNKWDLLQRSV